MIKRGRPSLVNPLPRKLETGRPRLFAPRNRGGEDNQDDLYRSWTALRRLLYFRGRTALKDCPNPHSL